MTESEIIARNEFACLEDDWESASRYLSIFIDETQETLDELTAALLSAEAGDRRQGIEQLFIGAHRIKGSAATIGLNRVAKLAHLMEDLLQVIVDEGRALEPAIADGMLACTDGLRQYVNAIKNGKPEDQFDLLARQLLDAREVCNVAIKPVSMEVEEEKSAEITNELRQRVAAVIREEENDTVVIGRVVFEPNLALVGLKARLIYSKLSNLGNVRYLDPPAENLENLDEIESLCFGVLTERTPETVEHMLMIAGVHRVAAELFERRKIPTAKLVAPVARAGGPPEHGVKPAETLRVDIERLDRLMNLAGQLTISKARITQIGDTLKKHVAGEKSTRILDRVSEELKKMANNATAALNGGDGHSYLEEFRTTATRLQTELEIAQTEVASFAKARGGVSDLFETIHQLDNVTDGIRRSVMDMRMLPIGPLFTRFQRVIRDITRGNGKDIHLDIHGESTELDKRMIDELSDPMIHLVRNSADHGVESPEEREAAGKPRQGTVSLDACHRGSNIVIRVSDDGRGLNADRIRAKAIEKGLVQAADAESMTRQQIFQFIWAPGLSTAQKVTDVSGRGVGMDIVRSKISELSGTVDVDSEPGRGTTFTIKLPLTLAILPSLMIEIDGDVFAVPLESVVEIVRVKRSDMATVHGRWTAPIRKRVVGVLRLGSIFKWGRSAKNAEGGPPEEIMLVVVGEGEKQLGLAVDDVLGEEDVVIKSIADNYRNVAGVAGATILGDGRISLILDPATLIEMSSHPAVVSAETQE